VTCRAELDEGNADVGKVYMMTRRQYVTAGMGEPIDISVPAIESAMRICRVKLKDRYKCAMRVKNLFHHFEAKP